MCSAPPLVVTVCRGVGGTFRVSTSIVHRSRSAIGWDAIFTRCRERVAGFDSVVRDTETTKGATREVHRAYPQQPRGMAGVVAGRTRRAQRSEEHTSELQSLA